MYSINITIVIRFGKARWGIDAFPQNAMSRVPVYWSLSLLRGGDDTKREGPRGASSETGLAPVLFFEVGDAKKAVQFKAICAIRPYRGVPLPSCRHFPRVDRHTGQRFE